MSQRRFRSPLGFNQLQADSYAMNKQNTIQQHKINHGVDNQTDESECCDSGDEGHTLFTQVIQRKNLNCKPSNTSFSGTIVPTN